MRKRETIEEAKVRKGKDCRGVTESKWGCRANGENTSQKSREVSEGDSYNVKIKMSTYENQE